MRRIAHISDLHFGRTEPEVLQALHRAVCAANPDLVVVSGDLTQRAREEQFAAARGFLSTLPGPQIIVPGNHDVPLYNVFKRWLMPLTNYRRHFGSDLMPRYTDDELAVVGLNTARAFALKNGRINQRQIKRVCSAFAPLREEVLRVVVTHHPFALPEQATHSTVLGRAKMAMQAFGDCKVDVVLSGHLHLSQATTSDTLYAGEHAALLIQAGTASSSRRRDEANAFNLLRIEGPSITVERHGWAEETGFTAVATQSFVKAGRSWKETTSNG